MARLAMVKKNEDNKKTALKYMAYRKELREKAVNLKLSDDERDSARRKLQALPRRTSIHRVITRCKVTGRARGNYKKFELCRLVFRKLALEGRLPGITKASW